MSNSAEAQPAIMGHLMQLIPCDASGSSEQRGRMKPARQGRSEKDAGSLISMKRVHTEKPPEGPARRAATASHRRRLISEELHAQRLDPIFDANLSEVPRSPLINSICKELRADPRFRLSSADRLIVPGDSHAPEAGTQHRFRLSSAHRLTGPRGSLHVGWPFATGSDQNTLWPTAQPLSYLEPLERGR